MTAPVSISLQVAQAIVSADTQARVFHKRWHRRSGSFDGPAQCAYCLAAVDTKAVRSSVLDYLVPVSLGGPALDANRVLACRSCALSKADRDLVAWQKFNTFGDADHRAGLLQRREKALADSLNHLTHTPYTAPRSRLLTDLQTRWAHPRFTVYAFHGVDTSWIGWTSRNGADDAHALAAVLLRFGCQAVAHSAGKLSLYELQSDKLLDALWVLIDHHAIVRPLTIDGLQAAPVDPDDWRHYWPWLFDDLADLHRRRARMSGSYRGSPTRPTRPQAVAGGPQVFPGSTPPASLPIHKPAPRKPSERSQTRHAIAMRNKREDLRHYQAKHAWLEARASLDKFKENVRQGLIQAPTLQELDLMEREVLDMKPTLKRPPRQGSRNR